jgi:Flp pilus assembly protein TadD
MLIYSWKHARVVRASVAIAALTAFLGGCVTGAGEQTGGVAPGVAEPVKMSLSDKDLEKPLWRALNQISDNDLEGANRTLNEALSVTPDDADMHFLNAYVYEIRGREEGLEVAEQAPAGYLAAFNNDSHHWAAAYRLGLWYLNARDYDAARRWLGEAALIKDDSAEIFEALATASYMSFDPDAADAFLDRAAELSGETPSIVRNRAIVSAARNRSDEAKALSGKYSEMAPPQQSRLLDARIRQWGAFHKFSGPYREGRFGVGAVKKAQFFGGETPTSVPRSSSSGTSTPNNNSTPEKAEELKKLPGMLVIDAVIIRQKTSVQESRGVNLLKQLQVTFSGNLLDFTHNSATGSKSTNTFNNTYKVNLGSSTSGSITYSLNIANNTDSRTEVLARPSISVVDTETGTFFLGEEVTYTISGDNADSFDKEVGITFEVTPELLDSGRVRLEARAEFDTFTTANSGVTFSSVIPTLKNKITSTAILELGQTLVLGGGTQEEKSKNVNATPVLGDVPLLQYLFRESTSVKADTSLIFLITPRLAETLDDPDQIEDAAGEQADQSESALMSQLRNRFRNWFDPTSNMTKALVGLSYSDLYREFRSGDLRFSDDDSDGDFDELLENGGDGFLNTYDEGFWPELLRYFYFK